MVDLSLFRARAFSGANLATFFLYFALSGILFRDAEAIEQLLRHILGDGLLIDFRVVKKSPALRLVRHQPALLHFAQHGRDGCIREATLPTHGFMHLCDGAAGPLPKHFHDFKLKLAEAVDFRFGNHNDRINTTLVVFGSTQIFRAVFLRLWAFAPLR